MPTRPPSQNHNPTIIITGASGFIGRNFLNAIKDHCFIYALASRSQTEAEIPPHENIQWMRGDIGEEENVARLFTKISKDGPVDFIFHFAAYYDFTLKESPEYQRTNIDGVAHLLKHATKLAPKRFIFASSLAVTDFSADLRIIDEKSPADAKYPYAISKHQAEKLVKEYSTAFPCTIVRLAAMFSDWCEYGPLYVLLNTWLHDSMMGRIVAGRGTTAVPYLHVADLNRLLVKIMEKHDQLNRFDIFAASDNGCTTHYQLFVAAKRYFFGKTALPFFCPAWVASLGVIAKNIIGDFINRPPFEKPWMIKYVDKQMDVDSSHTQALLDWQPKQRYQVSRRILFLIENLKSNPELWKKKNIAMAHKSSKECASLRIYNTMLEMKESIVEDHVAHLRSPSNKMVYPYYQKLLKNELKERAYLMYQMLEIVMLHGDRIHMLHYASSLAHARHKEGATAHEVINAVTRMAGSVEEALRHNLKLQDLQHKIRQEINITTQLITDEIEDVFDTLSARKHDN